MAELNFDMDKFLSGIAYEELIRAIESNLEWWKERIEYGTLSNPSR